MCSRTRAIVHALALLLACVPLSAQRPLSQPASRFSRLECTFTSSATVTWDTSDAIVRLRTDPPIEFQIGNIDRTRESADIILGATNRPALMVVGSRALSFVEPPDDGQMAITSVIVSSTATKFPASYSRTSYYAYDGPGFASHPQAEQHYGYCRPGRN